MVPPSAIQRGPQGTFVYVVKEDQTAALRPVTIGVIQEGNASITSGLSAGELVVVDGADRLARRQQGRGEGPEQRYPTPQRQNK